MTAFYRILLLLSAVRLVDVFRQNVPSWCSFGVSKPIPWVLLTVHYGSVSFSGTQTLVAVASAATRRSQRTKRGLLELAGAIKCSTGRSALAYMMYGCYCGLGGQGWPRDRADWCCHRHDCCYGDAERLGCNTKTDQYQWTCEDKTAECDDLEDKCEKLLCKCDRNAAKCLRRAPFIRKYALWPDFLCGYEHPMCNIY